MSYFPGMHFAEPVVIALYAMVVLIALSGLVVSIRKYRRGDGVLFTQCAALPVITLVLILTCLMLEVEHFWFGVDRLYERFALFFVPYLVLLTLQLLALMHARGWKKATTTAITLAALWNVFNCSRHFGPYRSVEWQYDVRTKDVVAAIALDMKDSGHQGPAVHIGVNWLFEPAMNFYRVQMGLDDIQPLDRDGITAADAYRVEFSDAEDSMVADGYRRMEAFPESGAVLFKKMSAPNSNGPDGMQP